LVREFPGIVCLWIPLPFKEILELFVLPKVVVVSDGLHFIFRFAFN
jgi:hypothetical protein